MYKIVNALQKFFAPFAKYAGILLIIAIFVTVAILALKYYSPIKKLTNEKFTDVANANRRTQTADVYLFFADWCPYCQKAKPEWQQLKDHYNNKGNSEGNYNVVFHDIDCTDPKANPDAAAMSQTFKVESYPTIKLTTDDGKKVDYDAKVSYESLVTFIQSTLESA